MKYTFENFYSDTIYILAMILYCVIVPLFIFVGVVLRAIWWIYEPLMKILGGTNAQKTQDK